MEQPAREGDVAAWLKSASDHTVGELATLPSRAEFAATLEKTTRAGVRYSDAQSAGGALFYRRQDPTDRIAKLVVQRAGVENVLLDPAAGTSTVTAIGNYSVSPDGRTVAVQVSKVGGESGETRFLDEASGRQVGDAVGPVWGEFAVTWLDNRRVTYTRQVDAATGVDPFRHAARDRRRWARPAARSCWATRPRAARPSCPRSSRSRCRWSTAAGCWAWASARASTSACWSRARTTSRAASRRGARSPATPTRSAGAAGWATRCSR